MIRNAGFIIGMALVFLLFPGLGALAQDEGSSPEQEDESSSAGQGVDTSVSHLYARYAHTALEDDRLEEASQLAEKSLEFSPTNADALHIRARTMLSQQEQTGRVLSDLETALSGGGRFRLTEKGEARRLLAETYLRVGRYEEALSIIRGASSEVPAEPRAGRESLEQADASARYIRARALRGLDRVEEAEQVALEGRNRFPEDPRFFLFLLRRDRIPGPRSGRWLDQHASRDPAYLEALLYYAQRSENLSRKQELAERYLRLGGEDPAVAILGAEIAAQRDEEEQLRSSWERFVDMGGLGNKSAVEAMFASLPAGAVKDRVREVLSRHDGILERDDDGNGYWEARFQFQDGELQRWMIDQNQNGEIDYDIEMADRVPQSLEATPEEYRVVYGSYPELSHVVVTEENEFRRFSLLPGSLTYDILDDELDWSSETPGPAFEFSLSSSPPILSEELVRRHSYRLEVGASDGEVTRVTSLSEGGIIREVYDQDSDGEIDRIVAFEDGEPAAGIRDSDRDGRFEVTEQYENGELAVLRVDRDGDGTVDYTEEFRPESGKGWDYDGDGSIDVYESLSSQDEVLRRYARGNGELDLSMTIYRETTSYE